MKAEVCAIFAIGPDNVIGIDDKMPWHSKQDFYHYKQVTKGYPCIFGDRTFFGLPKYPLTDRLNIVVKASAQFSVPTFTENDGGFLTLTSIESAINFSRNYSKIFICGGRSIYKYCLENNLIDTIYLTKIDSNTLNTEIQINPNRYIRFPLDIFEYVKDWNCEEIVYPKLPEENSDIIVKFLKYTKNKMY